MQGPSPVPNANQVSTILTQAAIGGNPAVIWGVDASQNIYRFTLDPNQGWTPTQIPGKLTQVSVGADGTVWGIGPSGNIERYNGNNSWTQIPGGLAQISVGSASLIWGVNPAGNIYQYNGSGWTMIAGGLKQVSVASDGTVWGVNAQGLIYHYAGNNAWTAIPGPVGITLTQVIVKAADSIWGLDSGATIYQYDSSNPTDPWAAIPDWGEAFCFDLVAGGIYVLIDGSKITYQFATL